MKFRQFKDSDKEKPTRYYSNIQETHVANTVNGNKVSNSGATPYNKGDVTDAGWLYECKTCMKDQSSFSIKKSWFTKNLEESIFMKKPHNAIVFNFGPSSKNYYVVDEQTFLDMKNALEVVEKLKL